MKLRKGRRYFVADPDHVRFGKRIPLDCRYRGHCDSHPKNHLFTFGRDGSYCLSDGQVTKLVEPFTKRREAEVEVEAEKYLAKMENRKPEKLVRGRLTAASRRAIAEAQKAWWAKIKRAG